MNVIRQEMNGLMAALSFLTRIPIGKWIKYHSSTLSDSLAYFPIVGAGVGLTGGAIIVIFHSWLPSTLVILLSMLTTVLITGGLHEDGLADAMDGLIGGDTVQRRLEIMRDSRVGSYGVIALWFAFAFKAILLYELLKHQIHLAVVALVIGHTLGRCSSLILLYFCRYVGTSHSKSQPFIERVSIGRIVLGTTVPVLVIISLWPSIAWVCLLILFIGTIFLKFYFEKKIDGVTGDCMGAASQIIELGCYSAIWLLLVKK